MNVARNANQAATSHQLNRVVDGVARRMISEAIEPSTTATTTQRHPIAPRSSHGTRLGAWKFALKRSLDIGSAAGRAHTDATTKAEPRGRGLPSSDQTANPISRSGTSTKVARSCSRAVATDGKSAAPALGREENAATAPITQTVVEMKTRV
jgi:hypothetical protein